MIRRSAEKVRRARNVIMVMLSMMMVFMMVLITYTPRSLLLLTRYLIDTPEAMLFDVERIIPNVLRVCTAPAPMPSPEMLSGRLSSSLRSGIMLIPNFLHIWRRLLVRRRRTPRLLRTDITWTVAEVCVPLEGTTLRRSPRCAARYFLLVSMM